MLLKNGDFMFLCKGYYFIYFFNTKIQKKRIQNKNRRKLEKENQKEKEKNTHLLACMKTLS